MKSHLSYRSVLSLLLATTWLLSLGHTESPSSWSRFHGADGRGVVESGKLPTTWTDQDYLWRRKLGSRDVGSPAIAGDKLIYLVSEPDQAKIKVESVDVQTGALLWVHVYAQAKHHLHRRNTFASSTPAIDEKHVFVAWSEPEHTYLKCFEHNGREIWSRDFGSWQSQHGFGTSPRVIGSMVLLFNSQQAEQLKPGQVAGKSRMIAVSRTTGNTIWETPLETTRSCYGVPALYHPEGRSAQIIGADTGNGLFGLDASSGEMLWNLKVFEMRCCSTPLVAGDTAIGSSGSGGGGNHLVAVKIPSSPREEPQQVYRIDRGAPYVPTPVLNDDRLYMIDDKGIASCINAQTGEQIWMERIGGNFGASPVLIGDTLLLISLDGQATLLKAGDKFEKLGEVDLGGPVGATPAYSDGRLFLRVDDELRCLGAKRI